MKVDFDTHDVFVDGAPEKLTQLEIDLLRYFSSNPGRVLSRDQILSQVWGHAYEGTERTVDNFVARLREKLDLLGIFHTHVASPGHHVNCQGQVLKLTTRVRDCRRLTRRGARGSRLVAGCLSSPLPTTPGTAGRVIPGKNIRAK